MRTIKVMGRGQLKIKPDYKNWIPKSMIAKLSEQLSVQQELLYPEKCLKTNLRSVYLLR